MFYVYIMHYYRCIDAALTEESKFSDSFQPSHFKESIRKNKSRIRQALSGVFMRSTGASLLTSATVYQTFPLRLVSVTIRLHSLEV